MIFRRKIRRSKYAKSFDSRQVLALFLYSVVNWAFFPSLILIRNEYQFQGFPDCQKFPLKMTFLTGKT